MSFSYPIDNLNNYLIEINSSAEIEPTERIGFVDLSGNNTNNIDISLNQLLSLDKLTKVDESNSAFFGDLNGITIIV